jgi:hypothetical protein
MSKPLEERLRLVKADLAKIETTLTTNSGTKVTLEVADEFKKVTAFANDVDHCLRMIEARLVARNVLTGLEGLVDANDTVPIGAGRAKYHLVRFLGLQAYLASKWALADRIAAVAGQVLCAPNQLTNEKRPPQLVSHFISGELESKTAALAFLSLRRSFGWPIGVSYAVRNHFVHDGGRNKADFNKSDFFDGDTAGSAFAISEEGWKHVENRAKSYGVEPTHHRLGAGWPVTPRADLRVVLEVCEREIDDALGVLVGSATRTLASHVGYIVGEL